MTLGLSVYLNCFLLEKRRLLAYSFIHRIVLTAVLRHSCSNHFSRAEGFHRYLIVGVVLLVGRNPCPAESEDADGQERNEQNPECGSSDDQPLCHELGNAPAGEAARKYEPGRALCADNLGQAGRLLLDSNPATVCATFEAVDAPAICLAFQPIAHSAGVAAGCGGAFSAI